jgi:hypothetical protein
MTEEQYERVAELKAEIWNAVTAVVDDLCKGEDPEVEGMVRFQLTEQFRFWRRLQ